MALDAYRSKVSLTGKPSYCSDNPKRADWNSIAFWALNRATHWTDNDS